MADSPADDIVLGLRGGQRTAILKGYNCVDWGIHSFEDKAP